MYVYLGIVRLDLKKPVETRLHIRTLAPSRPYMIDKYDCMSMPEPLSDTRVCPHIAINVSSYMLDKYAGTYERWTERESAQEEKGESERRGGGRGRKR